jgi:enoyl-CoA hydratase/carnithine racemase
LCLFPHQTPACTQPCLAVLRSLFENLKRAHSDARVKAIVVAGSNNNFSPGFDIQQFQNQVGPDGQ